MLPRRVLEKWTLSRQSGVFAVWPSRRHDSGPLFPLCDYTSSSEVWYILCMFQTWYRVCLEQSCTLVLISVIGEADQQYLHSAPILHAQGRWLAETFGERNNAPFLSWHNTDSWRGGHQLQAPVVFEPFQYDSCKNSCSDSNILPGSCTLWRDNRFVNTTSDTKGFPFEISTPQQKKSCI